MPRSPKEWHHETFLDAITYETIGFFNLAVCLRVSNGCKADVDPSFLAELHELSRSEVGAIIGDDAMRDPEPARNHLEEVDSCSGSLACDWYCFDPLSKFVDCDEQMCVVAVGRPRQRTNHVDPHWANGQAMGIMLSSVTGT